MNTHFDEKGKIYTDVIQKVPVWVTIQLPNQRVHGLLHIRSEKRIKEEMDDPENFLALTQVEVFSYDGQDLLFATRFLAINKANVIWILADTDRKQDQ